MLLAGLGLAFPAQAGIGSTFMVTSKVCTGAGSLKEAIDKANSTPGADTIEFTTNLVIAAESCPPEPASSPTAKLHYFVARMTESVTFRGNGAKLQGLQHWIGPSGTQSFGKCPETDALNIVTTQTPGFLEVGTNGQDNTGIDVRVENLKFDQMNSMAKIQDGGSATFDHVQMTRLSRVTNCGDPFFQVNGTTGSLTITNSIAERLASWGTASILGGRAIIGGQGTLRIANSTFANSSAGYAVYWVTGKANIVSSLFVSAGGLANFNSTMNVVNSGFTFTAPVKDYDRIGQMGGAGTLTMTASTVHSSTAYCIALDCRNTGYVAMPLFSLAGTMHLSQTAVGVGAPNVIGSSVIQTPGGTVTADPLTWIQPVANEDAAALKSRTGQPGLLTDAPGLLVGFSFSYKDLLTPLLGTTGSPGVLIDAVPDAQVGGANELKDPDTGLTITTDVFGNPRVDANDQRDIGAVQLVLAPSLSVTSVGDGRVTLGWTRPLDPKSGAITGYGIDYRRPGASTWTTIAVSGPDQVTKAVTGLANGTAYQFRVHGVNGVGDGPNSKTVSGTPLGPITPPGVTPDPGKTSVQVNIRPSKTGGRQDSHYKVVIAPVTSPTTPVVISPSVTSTSWVAANLVAGRSYRVCVYTVATDGTTSAATCTVSTTDRTPRVTSISPSAGPPAGGRRVNLTGVHFQRGMHVTVGGARCTTLRFNSSTSASCTVPSHAVGRALVVVHTTGGSSAQKVYFTYRSQCVVVVSAAQRARLGGISLAGC